ncbi:MAG: S8 family serine peptidase [Candidatus Marinimicrobia bacterium]|nr:S8 family serine peptidase [FCB group bacterium]MBL7024671.1 S8 family serine peptidase [Candidatus Neomarinimicrobiota bacterium]
MRTTHILLSIPLFFTLCFASISSQPLGALDDQGRPLWEEKQVMVKLTKNISGLDHGRSMSRTGMRPLDNLFEIHSVQNIKQQFAQNPKLMRSDLPDLTRIYLLETSDETNLNQLIADLKKTPGVEYAEGVARYYFEAIPNDTLYSHLAHLPQIGAEEAWDIHKGEDGTTEVVIGIVDSGMDWDHVDLVDNVYNNLGEDADGDGHTIEFIEGEWVFDPGDENGIDDDSNGYVDDFIGWNIYADSEGNENNDPADALGNYHGTHVAGLAAGVTNNGSGIASIAWNVKIMATSHGFENDGGHVYNAFQGIIYHAENGVDIINNSWGGNSYTVAGQEVIEYALGLGSIIIASAGNSGGNYPHYPSDYPGVVSVAAVDDFDYKTSYSNFGAGVDISSPGGSFGGLLSTYPGDDSYTHLSGTSMAGPLAAGALALLKSYQPGWSNAELLYQYLASADGIDDLNPSYANFMGHGRVNAYRALSDVNPSLPNEMRLALHEVYSTNPTFLDEEILPGDTTTLSFNIRNYAIFADDPAASIALISTDPTIQISPSFITAELVADAHTLVDGFQVVIGAETSSQIAELTLLINPSQGSISTGASLPFSITINSIQVVEESVSAELEFGQDGAGYLTVTNGGLEDIDFTVKALDPFSRPSAWHPTDYNAYDGESWYCGDDYMHMYGNYDCQIFEIPVFDLRESTNPTFSFMANWDIEEPSQSPPWDGWDAANVWVSTDGGLNYEPIYPDFPAYNCESVYSFELWFDVDSIPGWAGNNGGYEPVQFDLSEYRSEFTTLRIMLSSDPNQGATGFFMDDLNVSDDHGTIWENNGREDFRIRHNAINYYETFSTWFDFDDDELTIAAGQSIEVPYTMETSGLTLGGYSADLVFTTADLIPIATLKSELLVTPPTYDLGIRNYTISGDSFYGSYRVASHDTLSIILDNYGSEDAWDFLIQAVLTFEEEAVWSDSIAVAVLASGNFREFTFDPYFVNVEGDLVLSIDVINFEEDVNAFNNSIHENFDVETVVDRFWHYYRPNLWDYDSWDFSESSGYQDGQSMHCSGGVTPYLPNMDNSLTYLPGIEVGIMESLAIKYRTLYQLEDGVDVGTFEVSTDQENWTTLNSHTGTAISWSRHEIDLTEYCGGETEKLWFRFHFVSDAENEMMGFFVDHIEFLVPGVVSIDEKAALPIEFTVAQNFPNPFNPSTSIRFALPEMATTHLKIFDITGRLVKSLEMANVPAGWNEVVWNGLNNGGEQTPAGVYVARLEAVSHSQSIKMVLLK